MFKMAAAKLNSEDEPCCPICLEQFSIPRQLPCAHSFCEKCLHSHITTEATKHKKLTYVKCPVCRNSASPSIKDKPTSEWAILFPVNSVLQSILPAKSKVDRLCHACNNEGVAVRAEGFCVVCKEAMCGECLKFHKKQTISKDHTILSVSELDCNPENVFKLAEGFTCSEHHGEDIKYYCKDHSVPCCGTCFFDVHKICSKVLDLKKELYTLLSDSKPDEIITDMKKIEIHLKMFVEINESYLNEFKPQVNRLTDQIREVRKKINSLLDQLEKRIKTEGNRIYKEEVIKKQGEIHQCLSLIHAVRNSHRLLEAVCKYGNSLQKFLMVEKTRSQLKTYCTLVGEKYEKMDAMTVEVYYSPTIKSILSLSFSELGKVVTTASSNILTLTCSQRPTKYCQFESVDVIGPKGTIFNMPLYSGLALLPGDKVMLADFDNNQCILLSSTYQFITSHTLTGQPWAICILDGQDVAVSLYNQNKIHLLSVTGDIIRLVRTITTKHKCNGIAAAGKGEMVVNGVSVDNKSQWSLINTNGDVRCTHWYDSPYFSHFNHLVLNNMKTRVYVSVNSMHSLLCFNMNGRKQFTYSPDNLRGPMGVDVDKHDNIYVLGCSSGNMHRLSPDGSVLQVLTSGMPRYPRAICIHKSKDMLIITNKLDRTKLHIYQWK
ncbi:hypothetical protein CHS0354_001378 [Potamilus streckersoni]|uniref:RING-type domain-containing protein n=1 Tax=Potamilus streckersoni TaxID=2493646 RepID=A0AAE0TGH0_9BIVA|nr:hypothetical protein CHS0354_001378 [Potamilus streckersoni]